MANSDWEELYLQTVLETDAQKMQERIAAAREVIAGQLRDPAHDSDPQAERQKMKKALSALEVLEVETRTWL